MPEVRVTIGSRIGLHARPAAILARTAAGLPVRVRIGRTADTAVDAASVLAIMGLGVGAGESVVLTADGEGAEQVLDDLAALLARDLDTAEPAHD
jgi:phosphotransferase system HPr (HPr) family protein